MPQLSFETFVSQYFWLVFTLFALYYIMVTKLIPLISESTKARSNIDTKVALQNNAVKQTLDIAWFVNIPAISSKSYNTAFNKNFQSWAAQKKVN